MLLRLRDVYDSAYVSTYQRFATWRELLLYIAGA